jgi:hypothetical protein
MDIALSPARADVDPLPEAFTGVIVDTFANNIPEEFASRISI